jgi:hypothetical protein
MEKRAKIDFLKFGRNANNTLTGILFDVHA